MYYLRQATASQEMLIGPFLLATDGSVVTTLTIANTDIEIYKAGSATHVDKNSGGATHQSKGMYSMVFDATDTDTIGSGVAYVQVTGALPCKVEFCVLDEAVYDVMFGTVAPSTLSASDVASISDIVDAIEAGDVGTGITTLLTRIVGTLAAGTHNPQSGDAFSRIGAPVGASISADIAGTPAAVHATVVDGASITFIQAIRAMAASLAGKISGAPTGPLVYRNLSDTKNVVTVTADADGNRTTVTKDLT